MKTSFVIFFAIFAVASAAKTHKKRSTITANLNDYVDAIMVNLQNYIANSELEPLAIPNVTQSFSVKPLWITYSGRLSLYDGVLSNLASIKRSGNVELSYGDKILRFSANLGIDQLDYSYTYDAKLIGFLTANGLAAGSANGIATDIALSANIPKYVLALESFGVNYESISVTLKGNPVTDWFANAIIKVIISIVGESAINAAEDKVVSSIDGAFQEINDYIASLLQS